MSVFTLENEWLVLQASTNGAAIWRFFAKGESDEISLMRAPEAAGRRSGLNSGRARIAVSRTS